MNPRSDPALGEIPSTDPAQLLGDGLARIGQLPPGSRKALQRLLLDLFTGINAARFWKRWNAIDLRSAGSLTHLAGLLEQHFRLHPNAWFAVESTGDLKSRALHAQILLYLGATERGDGLPIPASSPHNQGKHLPTSVSDP